MNEMPRLGVAPCPPGAWRPSGMSKAASEFLSVEAKGMANLDERKHGGLVLKQHFFFLNYMFIWLGWGRGGGS